MIGVIDSGMTSAHPLAAGVIRGAFGAPEELGDDDQRGHGTSVAGITIYGDVRQRMVEGQFDARFAVAFAKLVNQDGKFPDEALVPMNMVRVIRRLHEDFNCRVINISLSDCKRMAGEKPTPWADILDTLARELDLLIVVSAGNRKGLIEKYGDGVVDAYPGCLLESTRPAFSSRRPRSMSSPSGLSRIPTASAKPTASTWASCRSLSLDSLRRSRAADLVCAVSSAGLCRLWRHGRIRRPDANAR